LRKLDTKETLVRLAELTGCKAETASHRDVSMRFGGVRCWLCSVSPEHHD
jgi:hypothetical protein